MTSSTNKRMLRILVLIAVMFLVLIANLTWFELFGKQTLMSSTYNKRMMADEQEIQRGQIVDRNGTLLAYSQEVDSVIRRIYPYKALYAHVIGYHSKLYGKTFIEASYNNTLLAKDALGTISKLEHLIAGTTPTGNQVKLTIDHHLQQYAREQLGNKNGAIVALNPKTGEILAMLSTPDFDPNATALEANWTNLINSQDSPFMAKSFMGLYPPGSTFKVITAIAAIENGLKDALVEDEGSIIIDGKIFSNANQNQLGRINLTQAITESSNVYFAALASEIGAKNLIDSSKNAGFDKLVDTDFRLVQSSLGSNDMTQTQLAATSIGQGKILATPMQMALVAAGIANDGLILKPYLVHSILNDQNRVLDKTQPQAFTTLTDPLTAKSVKDMMVSVVQYGTGKKAQIKGISVAGKTGTAQNEKSALGDGYDHAWFIGFAPADDPQIAIAVLLEYNGSGGGQSAAPIAKKIMDSWLKTVK